MYIQDFISHFNLNINLDFSELISAPINLYAYTTENIFLAANEYTIQDNSRLMNKPISIGKNLDELIYNLSTLELLKINNAAVVNNLQILKTTEYAFDKRGKKYSYLTVKMPFFDTGPVGIFGISIRGDINNPKMLQKFIPNNFRLLFPELCNNAPQMPLNLSFIEKQCLYALAYHLSIKEIAHYLQLSPRTVETYLCKIKQKLNCNSHSSLIGTAIELGLIEIKLK